MKEKIMVGILIAGLALLAACGSSSSTSDDGTAPTISTIDALPNATGPMAVTATASVSRDLSKDAETGLNLTTTTASDFSTASSMGSCSMFNNVKDGIISAAQGDQILCYVKHMQTSFAEVTDADGDPIDVYDGEWHIFNMNIIDCSTDAECVDISGEGSTCNTDGKCELAGEVVGGSPSRVKMQIVKNAAGSITSFEMFMCDANLVQNEYTKQTINDGALVMRAIGHFTSGTASGSHSVDVEGTLNSDSNYMDKIITLKNYGSFGGEGNTNWQEGTLTQGPGTFVFSGYNSGAYSYDGGTGTHADIVYGSGEMLGDSSADISAMAMGDGAVKYSSSGTSGDGSGVDAWLGDGAVPVIPATDSSYYNTANDGVLVTAKTEIISFTFAAAELWGCDDDVGVGIDDMPSSSQADMDAACSQFGGFSRDWINCQSIIEQEQEPEQ